MNRVSELVLAVLDILAEHSVSVTWPYDGLAPIQPLQAKAGLLSVASTEIY